MSPRDLVDRAIELPVFTSYTRIGPAVRRRLYHWNELDHYDLRGRVIAITGPTSGIGLAAAQQLADCGADLILVARNREKAEGVRRDLIEQSGNARIDVVVADMSDMADVRQAASEILGLRRRLDVLIHNAGTLNRKPIVAAGGSDQTYALQIAGPFLLTSLLRERLAASKPSRVITMASGGMYLQRLTVKGLAEPPTGKNGARAYAIAKRAQVTLNEMWATRTAGSGIVFAAMHPGWVETPGLEDSLPTFRRIIGPLLRNAAQGADTLCWLAADDGAPLEESGRFWLDRHPRPIHIRASTRRSDTPRLRERLWQWCVDYTGAEAVTT